MPRKIFIIESDLSASARAAERIGVFCRKVGLEGNMLAVIELCAVEALNNAIEHAHASVPDTPVEVDVELEDGELTIRVRDHGHGMPAELLRHAPRDVTWKNLHLLPERGPGLVILRRAMDEVTYGSSGDGNTLTMRKRIEPSLLRRSAAG